MRFHYTEKYYEFQNDSYKHGGKGQNSQVCFVKKGTIFCITCFSINFSESSKQISLLSSTQSGMKNEQVLMLKQEWMDMTWHTV
jgi:hypothetical protein